MFEWKGKEAEGGKKEAEPNRTGIPAQLKKSLEQNTGFSFDDVRVHYDSDKPAGLDALAYTQGNQVYIGPGQKRHLPHELGHVVQQKLGIVHADTKHESGAAMNTDAALERQADEIGSGRMHLPGYPVEADTDTIQRMSVFEKEGDGKEKVARYKRRGWIALQGLRAYFTEESLDDITYRDLKEYEAVLQEFMGKKDRELNFARIFPELYSKLQFKIEIEQRRWNELPETIHHLTVQAIRTEGEVNEGAGTEQRERAAPGESGEEAGAEDERQDRKIAETGRYERVGDINPYFNAKKIAMHCIAALTARNTRRYREKESGPHIAMVVIGERILVAINSQLPDHGYPPVTMEELKEETGEALEEINLKEIMDIMKEKGWYKNLKAPFEGMPEGTGIEEEQALSVLNWIQRIKKYEIVVIGVSNGGTGMSGRTVHGEMAILDYLIAEQDRQPVRPIPNMPKTMTQILTERQEKLNNLGTTEQIGDKRRVIQFGGTKVDCKRCHEHFAEAAGRIKGNRIISSEKVGLFEGRRDGYYPGTKEGTYPQSSGSAYIAASELKVNIDEINKELAKLLAKLTAIAETPGTAASLETAVVPDLSEEETGLIEKLPQYRLYFEPGRVVEDSESIRILRGLIDRIISLSGKPKTI